MTEESKQDYRFAIIVSAIIITCYIALAIAIGWLLLEYGDLIREWAHSLLTDTFALPDDFPTSPNPTIPSDFEMIAAFVTITCGALMLILLLAFALIPSAPETPLIPKER